LSFFTASETIVIPNGINFSEATEAAQQPVAFLSRLDRSKPLLCTAARLVPEKNLQLLLNAVSHVQTVRPVTLMIVGDGPDYGALQYQAAALGLGQNVIFLGHQKTCYPYLHCVDLFIHTCLFEGFGYTMLEAMAVGTPVIATDCPYGPREIIGQNEFGLLVPPDDSDALAEAILLLLQHSQLREILARRGMERAKDFSIETTIKQYEAVFKSMP
jgi:glycosyltransferase involved in cell wall biosynthesis